MLPGKLFQWIFRNCDHKESGTGNENRMERVDDIGLLIDCANINGSGTFLCHSLNEILSI